MRRTLVRALAVADNTITKYEVRKLTPITLVVLFAAWIVPSLCMMAAAFHFSSADLSVLGMVMLAGPFLLTGLAHALVWGNKMMHRQRTLGHGDSIPADLYWKISDLLESRGITNVNKYITEHPEHRVVLHELYADLYSPHLTTRDSWNTALSLIFLNDDNPYLTRDSITTLLNVRGVRSIHEVKAMLEITTTTATPLASGVL
jgi:hypothetical protein